MLLAAIFCLTALGLSLGYILGYASRVFKVETSALVSEIETMLPGSQCGQCGYPGCTPAAMALANGEAPVTVCPPGGKILAEELAAKLGVSVDLSDMEDGPPMVARVFEDHCTGCTRCFKVCPTYAIVGGPKQIHVVIRDACTGCKSCIKVCPTECLQMYPIEVTLKTWKWEKPKLALAVS